MKILFSLLLLIFNKSLFGQDEGCKVLFGLFKNKDTQRIFYLDDTTHLPVTIIDTGYNFAHCNFEKINSRSVEIVHDTSLLNNKQITYVIIHSLMKKGRVYKMKIQQKATGAFGYIEFKRMKDEYIVSKLDVGYF